MLFLPRFQKNQAVAFGDCGSCRLAGWLVGILFVVLLNTKDHFTFNEILKCHESI